MPMMTSTVSRGVDAPVVAESNEHDGLEHISLSRSMAGSTTICFEIKTIDPACTVETVNTALRKVSWPSRHFVWLAVKQIVTPSNAIHPNTSEYLCFIASCHLTTSNADLPAIESKLLEVRR